MSYHDQPITITVADQKAAIARRTAVVASAPPPPSAAEIKAALAARVAKATRPVPVPKPPASRRAVVASGRSDSVSLRLQSPEMLRFESLLAELHGGRPCPGESCCA